MVKLKHSMALSAILLASCASQGTDQKSDTTNKVVSDGGNSAANKKTELATTTGAKAVTGRVVKIDLPEGIKAGEDHLKKTVKEAIGLPKLKWQELISVAGDKLYLPVEISGVNGGLMIDTGSAETLIRQEMSKKLKIDTISKGEKRVGIGGLSEVKHGKIEAKVKGVTGSEFATLSGEKVFMPVSLRGELPDNGEIFGVIGMEDLSSAGVIINCQSNLYSLKGKLSYQPPAGTETVTLFKATYGSRFVWMLEIEINGVRGMMVVDTGAQATVMDKAFGEKAKLTLVDSKYTASGAGDKSTKLQQCTIPEIKISKQLKLEQSTVMFTDLSGMRQDTKSIDGVNVPFAGIIGMDHLRVLNARLDCQDGVAYLTPKQTENKGNATATEPSYQDMVNALMALAKNGDKEASGLLAKAQAAGGQLELSSVQGKAFYERAVANGLMAGATASTGPDAGDSSAAITPSDVVEAIGLLSQNGDEEAKRVIAEAQANGGKMAMTPEMGKTYYDRAVAKGLLKKKSKGEVKNTAPSYTQMANALQLLAANGDEEAVSAMTKAQASGGQLALSAEQGKAYYERAVAKGLMPATTDPTATGPSVSPANLNPGDIVKAIEALAQSGDAEAQSVMTQAQASGGQMAITPEMGQAYIERAKVKGLLGTDVKNSDKTVAPTPQVADSAATAKIDPLDMAKALAALANSGDADARAVYAKSTGGKLEITDEEGKKLYDRAVAKGLIGGSTPAPQPAETTKKPANSEAPKNTTQEATTPATTSAPAEAFNPNDIVAAIQALVQAGDQEAMAAMTKAQAAKGKLELTPEQGKSFYDRAVAKGLLKKATSTTVPEAKIETGNYSQKLKSALARLADSGDEEAKKIVADGRSQKMIAIGEEKAAELIKRAEKLK